ncbi:MAG: hypothetical protein HDS53_04150 [Barnesiella sp.]|nr:hypothetical protein [Barnesiella sp.]
MKRILSKSLLIASGVTLSVMTSSYVPTAQASTNEAMGQKLLASNSGQKSRSATTSRRGSKAASQSKPTRQAANRGPEWLQGSWELTISGPFGPVSTYHLSISGENAHLVEGSKEKYNGRFEVRDGYLIVGPRKYYIDNDDKRLNYMQYSWRKTGGSSSQGNSARRGGSFKTSADVMRYLDGQTFYNGSDGLRISSSAVYLNGRALTGAPRVKNVSGSTAVIEASSPYAGGSTLRFYVNSSNGTVTQNGDVYRAR